MLLEEAKLKSSNEQTSFSLYGKSCLDYLQMVRPPLKVVSAAARPRASDSCRERSQRIVRGSNRTSSPMDLEYTRITIAIKCGIWGKKIAS